MRLIDADALIAQLKAIRIRSNDLTIDYKRGHSDGIITAVEYADDAPTIDAVPVVRGEWLVTDAYPHRVYCSLCYKTNVPNEESLFERNEYPKFCMWCGKRLEGKL